MISRQIGRRSAPVTSAPTLALALTFVLTLALAGCGVPSTRPPVDLGAMPKTEQQEQSQLSEPPGPDGSSKLGIDPTPRDLVDRYLTAAAWANVTGGDKTEIPEAAAARVRQFMTERAANTWKTGTELLLVRPNLGAAKSVDGQTFTVDGSLTPVGVLDSAGAVHPPTSTVPIQVSFQIVQPAGQQHRRLENVPSGLLLDVNALNDLYTVNDIYFWSGAGDDAVLLPDRRYMPKNMAKDKQPNEVWRWLAAGPSEQIAKAVLPIPAGATISGNIVTEQSKGTTALVVNLAAEAAGLSSAQRQSLVVQLRWSLRPYLEQLQLSGLQLRLSGVADDTDGTSNGYLFRNPAYTGTNKIPEALYVMDGRVNSADSEDGSPSAVLRTAENAGVVTAAVAGSGDDEIAALVRAEADGNNRLWIGRIGNGRVPIYQKTEVVGKDVGQPVFQKHPKRRVLLTVDGELKVVSADGHVVPVEANGISQISAVASAPDDRRLALVAGGQVGTALLLDDAGGLTLGPLHSIDAGVKEPKAVGWTAEDRILVGGRTPDGPSLMEVSADGAIRDSRERPSLAGQTITRMSTHPDNPGAENLRVLALYEVGGQAFYHYSQDALLMTQNRRSSPNPAPSDGNHHALSAPFYRT